MHLEPGRRGRSPGSATPGCGASSKSNLLLPRLPRVYNGGMVVVAALWGYFGIRLDDADEALSLGPDTVGDGVVTGPVINST